MPTQIEDDAEKTLIALAQWSNSPEDPHTGRYQVTGEELEQSLGTSPSRLNDAIQHLDDLGLIETVEAFGTGPFSFASVSLNTTGRLTYQKGSQKSATSEAPPVDYDVFLSHSSLDDVLTADIKRLLETNKIRTFATPESIPTGT